MKNRVTENWLINANELAFEIPFCQLLISQGYKLIHKTRHGPFEQGKDIIASKDGEYYGFQLKSGNITQQKWQSILAEVTSLVEIELKHPAIPSGMRHNSVLVTNGDLSEEVRIEIDDRNKNWKSRGYRGLNVITKGMLLDDFQKNYGDYFPTEIGSLTDFLNLYTEDGREHLHRDKMAKFLESFLPIDDTLDNLPKNKIRQLINSSVILVSYLLEKKIAANNFVAVLDAWTIQVAYIFLLAQKYKLNKEEYSETIKLLFSAIETNFNLLTGELKSRKNYLEAGNPLTDFCVYKTRITITSGYISAYALYEKIRYSRDYEKDFILSFLDQNTKQLTCLGEWFNPLILNTMLARRCFEQKDALVVVSVMLEGLLRKSRSNEVMKTPLALGLPDPYHSPEEIIKLQLGLIEDLSGESFVGLSYGLETIKLLHAYYNLKEELSSRWARIVDVQEAKFSPAKSWHNFRWENRDEGDFSTRFLNETQSWGELLNQSKQLSEKKLPEPLDHYPEFLPLFLSVFPHRFCPELILPFVAKLESKLTKSKK